MEYGSTMREAERRKLVEQFLADLLTVADMTSAFGVTPMTVHNWINFEKMPHVAIPGNVRPALRFVWSEVEQWAKDTGHTVIAPPKKKRQRERLAA